MFDNKSTYTVRIAESDGATRYYASFVDGNGTRQEIEINREIYLTLEDCRRHENRQQRSVERHLEQLNLSEGQLAERLSMPPMPLEDCVALIADMQAAIASLTATQRRRFLLHHELGLSFLQIARAEKLSKQAIAQSVGMAVTRIKKYFDEGG